MYSSTNHPHTRRHFTGRQLRNVVAATALTATTTILTAPSATAGHTAIGSPGEEPFSRPCFMVQATWNEALDGAQPQCPAPTNTTSSTETAGEPEPLYGKGKIPYFNLRRS